MCREPDREPEEPGDGWYDEFALLCTLAACGAILLAYLWRLYRG